MQDMEIPAFLSVNDADEIMDEMLALVPDEFDKSEGSHYYNFNKPTANIVSQMRGFDLPEAIKLIWPDTSHGEYLEKHAERLLITRKEAQYAVGEITFTGKAGTVIPSGYAVYTESKNAIASKGYVTTSECVIGENGTVTVGAIAIMAGKIGNTAANTVVINASSYEDITSITNEKAFTGGVEEEDDDSLYKRIYGIESMQGDRNTGNPSDYKRWALEVPGTGAARVIRPKDSSGLVTIILTDGNGDPANETLCNAVYNHIMSPNDEDARIAPCGAFLKVIPPETITILVSAKVELSHGRIEDVRDTFTQKLKEYYPVAIEHKEVLYHKICNVLGDIDGVYDISNVTVNGSTSNIALDDGVFPQTEVSNITLTLVE